MRPCLVEIRAGLVKNIPSRVPSTIYETVLKLCAWIAFLGNQIHLKICRHIQTDVILNLASLDGIFINLLGLNLGKNI